MAFSRKDIFNIKREIESRTPHKCCVIFGSLPQETRANQVGGGVGWMGEKTREETKGGQLRSHTGEPSKQKKLNRKVRSLWVYN